MPNTELLGFSRSPNSAASSSLKPASLGSSRRRGEESADGGAAKADERRLVHAAFGALEGRSQASKYTLESGRSLCSPVSLRCGSESRLDHLQRNDGITFSAAHSFPLPGFDISR